MPERPSNSEAPIEIVEYQSAWPGLFEEEARALHDVLKPWLAGPVEHIGSTAVPGLPAKPVIDIMAAVRDLPGSKPAVTALEALGYQYFPYRPDVMHWFCKPSLALRTHHLHLVPFQSRLWKDRIRFRDVLRASADLAADYARLKRDFAKRYRLDREAYTEAKGPFVARVLGQDSEVPGGTPAA